MKIYKQADNVRVGPFSTDQIRSMIIARTLSGHDLIWYQGLQNPIKVSDSEHFSMDAMIAEIEPAGHEAGAELMKAVEEVTLEARKTGRPGCRDADPHLRVVCSLNHRQLLLERMDAGTSAARSGRWLVPGPH